jgi:hypothetical protein
MCSWDADDTPSIIRQVAYRNRRNRLMLGCVEFLRAQHSHNHLKIMEIFHTIFRAKLRISKWFSKNHAFWNPN